MATATLTAACASRSNVDVDTGRRGDLIPVGALLEQCPTVVEGDGDGSLTVSVSNATLVDSDPMVVAVAVDGAPVLCEAVMAGNTDTYTDFTVPVTREDHVVTVDVWTDGDPEAGFRVRAFSSNRDVDPVETPRGRTPIHSACFGPEKMLKVHIELG